MSNRTNAIETLRRLILHPATSAEEKEAAQLALGRLLSESKKEKLIRGTVFADVFKRGMERTFKP